MSQRRGSRRALAAVATGLASVAFFGRLSFAGAAVPSSTVHHRAGGRAPAAAKASPAARPVTGKTGTTGTSTAVYTSTVTVAAPPASTFPGANGGGDGWAVALSATQVFNVFHHSGAVGVECHDQSDGTECTGYPKTVTESDSTSNNGAGFTTSGQPGLWLDQRTGDLYVFATRETDKTAGVVCVDTTSTSANPYCGFTALSAAGDANWSFFSGLSEPVLIGSDWYAFNYVPNAVAPTGTQNEMLCFDLAALAPCANQPYPVTMGSGAVTWSFGQSSPGMAAFGGEIVVPVIDGGQDELACFDPSGAGGTCAGNWPVALDVNYPVTNGPPFPLLGSTGQVEGFCIAIAGSNGVSTDPCFDLTGQSVATPDNLSSVVFDTNTWNGAAVTVGPRVYVPNNNFNEVQCFDYRTGAGCAGFPLSFQNLGGLYTVNSDPQRPTCLWVNADNGSAQIQNFDLYTAGACQLNPVRVLASAVVGPLPLCAPVTWDSLKIVEPTRGQYSSASVEIDDDDANPVAGLQPVPVDQTGSVDLTGVAIPASAGVPEFAISFTGPPDPLAQVKVQLTWTAEYSPDCVQGGTSVEYGVTLDKAVADPTPDVGSQDSLTLTATSVGSSAAGDVVVTDVLAPGLSLVSTGPSVGTVGVAGQTLTWTIPSLGAAGATATLQIVVTVLSAATVLDAATFVETPQGTDFGTSGTSNTVTIVPSYSVVSVLKAVSDAAPDVGSRVTFTLTAENAGPSDAGAVTVTDPLPAALRYVSASTTEGTVGETDRGGVQTVTWQIPDLVAPATGNPPTQATAEIVVTVASSATSNNIATFTEETPDASGGTSGSSNTVAVTPVYADLSLTKAVSDATPDVGSRVTFTLELSNTGTAGSGSTTVTDRLAGGLTFDSARASEGSAHESGGTVTWSLADLAAGASATLEIVATVGTDAKLANTASFEQTVPDSTGGTTGSSGTVVVTPLYAVLGLSKTAASASRASGADESYTITVTDAGPDAARGVVVSDALPSGLSFVSAAGATGSVTTAAAGGVTTVTWRVGSLADGKAASLTVVAKVTATSGTVTNVASAVESTFDPEGSTTRASATVTVVPPAVVPPTHTGEPWSGPWYWLLVGLLGAAGSRSLAIAYRRRPRAR